MAIRCSSVVSVVSRNRAGWLVTLLLATSASGCVLGSDSDPPQLVVDFVWDRASAADRFAEGSCETADVISMDWQLLDHADHVVTQTKGERQDCVSGFQFDINLDAGDYSLVVNGYDDQDQKLWSSTCDGLYIDRFDRYYRCDIDQSPP
jgi:hypothetical protein